MVREVRVTVGVVNSPLTPLCLVIDHVGVGDVVTERIRVGMLAALPGCVLSITCRRARAIL